MCLFYEAVWNSYTLTPLLLWFMIHTHTRTHVYSQTHTHTNRGMHKPTPLPYAEVFLLRGCVTWDDSLDNHCECKHEPSVEKNKKLLLRNKQQNKLPLCWQTKVMRKHTLSFTTHSLKYKHLFFFSFLNLPKLCSPHQITIYNIQHI